MKTTNRNPSAPEKGPLKLGRLYLILMMFPLFLGACASSQSEKDYKELKSSGVIGQVYYLKHTIYYFRNRFTTTNYHVQRAIPINVPVRVLAINDTKIKLQVIPLNRRITIINDVKYSHQPLGAIFDQLLSRDPVSLKGLTSEEKEAVIQGKIKRGMSKRAVVMAYGYPPLFMTESLDDNTWTYWISRLSSIEVIFDNNGKVERIVRR